MAAQTRQRSANIPPIVSDTISVLEEKALQEQGILRVSGSALQIQNLMKEYEKGKAVDLSKTPIHTVAGLLKRYFKDSPESLLTFDLYDDFLATAAIQEAPQRIEEIKNLVESLPLANQEILHKLTVFLTHVSQYSEINSMTKGNLSTMFGPQLLRTAKQDGATMMQDMPKIFFVIHTMIENHEAIFPGWPDDQEIKPGSEHLSSPSLSGKKGASENLAAVKRRQKAVEKAIAKWYGKTWKTDLTQLQNKGSGIAVPIDRPRTNEHSSPDSGLILVVDDRNLSPIDVDPESSSSSSSSSSADKPAIQPSPAPSDAVSLSLVPQSDANLEHHDASPKQESIDSTENSSSSSPSSSSSSPSPSPSPSSSSSSASSSSSSSLED